ncbi:MAG: glycine-rich protein [Bacteroidales bacterium]|nr:glycine-rich protein [Bacteroidales bacterium]
MGTLNTSPGQLLYIVVGGNPTSSITGGYNGGGSGNTYFSTYGGGGATHIATSSGVLSSLSGNRNAVLIVAGGGGGTSGTSAAGGVGGGLTTPSTTSRGTNYGATQSGGGTSSMGGGSGSFGQGGAGEYGTSGSGGGGGWYGGAGSGGDYPSFLDNDDGEGGTGGSGYIDGVTNAQTIAGNQTMPNPAGGTMTGREGNGFARITVIGGGEMCESPVASVHVSVVPPQAPEVQDVEITCGETTHLAVADAVPGYTYIWYSDPQCTQEVHTGSTWDIPMLGDNTTYYVKSMVLAPLADTIEFSYTGGEQTFTAPVTTTYSLQVWGGAGGNGSSSDYNAVTTNGGKGGYSSGEITLNAGQTVYINVAGAGTSIPVGSTASNTILAGGYNGGGYRSLSTSGEYGSSGGGATHIATVSGLLSSLSGNRPSVLIVAGGGGGHGEDDEQGGAGGGTVGVQGSGQSYPATAGTQSGGGTNSSNSSANGSFGQGGNTIGDGGGGGGGWYGGASPSGSESLGADGGGGSGGSGYIGGVNNGQTIAGNQSMPNPAGGTMTGREGNGYARIIYNDLLTLCVSDVAEVNITVNPIENPILEDVTTLCGTVGNLAPTNVNNDFTYRWYADPECTELLYEGALYETPQVVNQTTFYLVAYSGEIEGGLVEGEPIEFTYSGSPQSYIVPPGVEHLKLQLWGAQGGNGGDGPYLGSAGGKGAYVEGIIDVNLNDQFTVVVGQQGGSTASNPICPNCPGGNGGYGGGGGGSGGWCSDNAAGGGGGGGFSMVQLNSSILMVAAGGGGGGGGSSSGGSQHGSGGAGGAGGALNGINGSPSSGNGYFGYGATENSGGAAGSGGSSGGYLYGGGASGYSSGSSGNGSTYAGGVGGSGGCSSSAGGSGGGGGGYYGGGGAGNYASGGGGGRSFVTGMYDAQMIAGNQEMPTPTGELQIGRQGNGFARIIPMVNQQGGFLCTSDTIPVTVSVTPIEGPFYGYSEPPTICTGSEATISAFAMADYQQDPDAELPMILWYADANTTESLGFTNPEVGGLVVNPLDTTIYYAAAATDMLTASGYFEIATPPYTQELNGLGCFFDVQAGASAVSIQEIKVTTVNEGNYPIYIYYKSGTCESFTGFPSAWTLVENRNFNTSTNGDLTISLLTPFEIPADQLYSIYVSTDAGIQYNPHSEIGTDVLRSSRFLTLYQGYGVPNTPSTDAGGFYDNLEHRNYVGQIGYELNDVTIFGCISENRYPIQVNVGVPPEPIDTIFGDTTICQGESVTLTANGGFLGDNGYYEWFEDECGTNLLNETTESVTVSPFQTTTYYVRRKSDFCDPTECIAKTVYVTTVPIVSDIIQPATICDGDQLPINTPSWDYVGMDDVIAWSNGWQYTTDGSNYVDLTDLTITEELNGSSIHYMVQNHCGFGYSNDVIITVDSMPAIATLLTPDPICYGNQMNWAAFQPQVDFHNNSGAVTSEGWEVYVDGVMVNYSADMILPYGHDITVRYWAQNYCGITYSNYVNITIYNIPRIGNLAEIAPICAGIPLPVTAPAIIDNGNTEYSESWEYSPIYNAGVYTTFPIDSVIDYGMDEYYIKYAISNVCGTARSNFIQIIVNDIPQLTDITDPNPREICSGSPLVMTPSTIISNGGLPCTEGWVQSPDSLINENTPFTAFNITDPVYDTWRGSWVRYRVENGCGITYSRAVEVMVHPAHHLYLTPVDTTVCFGSNVEIFSYTDLDDNSDYQWSQTDGGHLVSFNTSVVGALRPAVGTQRYEVVVTDRTTGCSETAVSQVEVIAIGSEEYRTVCASELPLVFGDDDNRVICNRSGDYYLTFQSSTGCDSVVTLHLSVLYPVESRVVKRLCEGETYHWYVNGENYTESAMDTVRILRQNGCDSIVYYLDLRIGNQPYIDIASRRVAVPVYAEMEVPINCRTACEYNSDIKLAMDFQLYKDGVAVGPMDTFGRIRIETEYPLIHEEFGNILQSGLGSIPGTTYSMYNYDYNFFYFSFFTTTNNTLRATWTEPGEYKFVFRLVEMTGGNDYPYLYDDTYRLGGAGSTHSGRMFEYDSLTIIVSPVDTTTEEITLCESQLPYDYYGNEISRAGDYHIMFEEEENYEMRLLHVNVAPTLYTSFTVRTCQDDYVWDGVTYNTDSYLDPHVRIYQSEAGCDSIVSLFLTLNNTQFEEEININACNEYTWDVTGITYTESGDYTYFNYAENIDSDGDGTMDCDTLLTLHLTVNYSDTTRESLAVASSQLPYNYYGNLLTSTGTYTYVLPTIHGCDSVVILDFVVSDPIIMVDTTTLSPLVGVVNRFTLGVDAAALDLNTKVALDYEITRNGVLIDDVSRYGTVHFDTRYPDLNRYIGRDLLNGLGSVPTNTFNVIYFYYNYFYLHFMDATQNRLTATWNVPGSYTIKFILREYAGGTDVSPEYGNPARRIGGSGALATQTEFATREITMNIPEQTVELYVDTVVCSSNLPFIYSGEEYNVATQTDLTFTDAYGVNDTIVHLNLTINQSYDFIYSDNVCAGSEYQNHGFHLTAGAIDSLVGNATRPYQIVLHHYYNTALGCDSTVTLYLTVMPNVPLSANDITICANGDAVLSATGCDYYNWESGASGPTDTLYNLLHDATYAVTGYKEYHLLASVNQVHIGDIMTNDNFFVSPANFTESGKTAVGVVYRIDSTADLIYMVALRGKLAKWSGDDITVINAGSMTNGRDNMAAVRAIGGWRSIYPAFNYCDTLTINTYGDWYLPAVDEVYDATTANYIDQSLITAGLSPIVHTFLTSTENSLSSCYAVDLLTDGLMIIPKDSIFHVNAISTVTPSQNYLYETTATCMALDSVYVTVIPLDSVADFYATVCQGEPYTENGFDISAAETQLPGVVRDTIITGTNYCGTYRAALELRVLPVYNQTFGYVEVNAEVCEGSDYQGYGFVIPQDSLRNLDAENNTYFYSYGESSQGCDSITRLTLHVNPTVYHYQDVNVCYGSTYSDDIREFTVLADTLITDQFTLANGCDSIDYIQVYVMPLPTVEIIGETTLCYGGTLQLEAATNATETNWQIDADQFEGSSLTIDNMTVSLNLDFVATLGQCTTTTNLLITVIPEIVTYLDAETCADTYFTDYGFDIEVPDVAGEYEYVLDLTAQNGCDSTVFLAMNVIPMDTVDVDQTISIIDVPYRFFDQLYSESGTYYVRTAGNNCDMIIRFNLTITNDYGENAFILLDSVDEQTYELTAYANQMDQNMKVALLYTVYKDGQVVSNLEDACGGRLNLSTYFLNSYVGRSVNIPMGSIPTNTFSVGNNQYNYFYFHFFNRRPNLVSHTFTTPGEYEIVFDLLQQEGGTDYSLTYTSDFNTLEYVGGKNSTDLYPILATRSIFFTIEGESGGDGPGTPEFPIGNPTLSLTTDLINEATSIDTLICSKNAYEENTKVSIEYTIYDGEEPISMLSNVANIRMETYYGNMSRYIGKNLTEGTGNIPGNTFAPTTTYLYNYFYLHFLNSTHSRIITTWAAPGDYSIVFNLVEMTAGTDFGLTWTTGKRLGGKNAQSTGLLLATETLHYNIGVDPLTAPTGIEDNENDGNTLIDLYPNPAQTYFVMTLGELGEEANITITDVNGKLMSQYDVSNVNDNQVRVDIAQWAQGVYFVTLNDGANFTTKKLVITK